MKRKKTKINKQTIIISLLMILLGVSLVANGYLFSRIQPAIDIGYIEGFKVGGLEGFKVGLETGRACITDGVAGVCEGTASVGGEMRTR